MCASSQGLRKGDLRVVVMSATLDAVRFAAFFEGAKVVYLQVEPISLATSCIVS